MPTHDYIIDNQTAPAFRADLNQALQAIVSNNSNATVPTITYANMIWYDTTNKLLRMRNEADDAFITLGTLDQVAGTFQASYSLGFTPVQQGGGSFQGTNKVYIGWDGSNIRVQVDVSDQGPLTRHTQTIGIGQTWQAVGRALNTSYLNNTGKPIHVSAARGGMPLYFEVSQNNSSWLRIASAEISGGAMVITHTAIIPDGYYYRLVGGSGNPAVAELR